MRTSKKQTEKAIHKIAYLWPECNTYQISEAEYLKLTGVTFKMASVLFPNEVMNEWSEYLKNKYAKKKK